MRITFTTTIILIFVILISGQEDIRPWEKLGISQTEWMMIQNNQLPLNKVHELLRDGIGISEYFDKPWIELELTEAKWIAKRRSGLTNEDIRSNVRHPKKDDSWKEGNREIIRSDITAVSENGQRFSALFLPGYQQHKADRKVVSNIMIGLSAGSLLWCGIGSVTNRRFEGLPVFTILVPTMVWSLVDFSVYTQRKQRNQE